MLLENKNAIIYGGGGSIGGAVAKEFAREGAKVFLAGRTRLLRTRSDPAHGWIANDDQSPRSFPR